MILGFLKWDTLLNAFQPPLKDNNQLMFLYLTLTTKINKFNCNNSLILSVQRDFSRNNLHTKRRKRTQLTVWFSTCAELFCKFYDFSMNFVVGQNLLFLYLVMLC